MGIYIEALILYIILFLSGSISAIGNSQTEAFPFSVSAHLNMIILYYIPSLVLIWYLIFKGNKDIKDNIKPSKTDLPSFFAAFPCLMLTGISVSYVSQYISGFQSFIIPASPSGIAEWTVLCSVCLLSAYLEESYFRYYILSKRNELNMGKIQAVIFSSALFSVCHIYEGPWGFLNSIIAGGFLAFLFLKYRSLHGISLAHAFYNIAAYIMASLEQVN